MSAPAPSMYSPEAQAVAAKLGLRMGKPNLEVFAATLQELAKTDTRLFAVTSDSRGSGKLGPFGQALPEQIVEVGIAEQNLVGIAAGMASFGHKVFAVSPACFLTARSLEQIKNDVCYSDHAVALVGISAGVSYGALGSTHHSLHDLAALRAIHNLEVLVPADNGETAASVRAAAAANVPMYLRFGKAPLYDLPAGQAGPGSEWRAARILREGSDLAFVATGEAVIHALLAAEALQAAHGVSARVISACSVKPLPEPTLLAAARECGAVITVEEHSVNGGLGEACASLLLRERLPVRFDLVGIPDEYTVTGSQSDIFRHYGISMEGLLERARTLLGLRS